MAICEFCGTPFRAPADVRRHQALARSCRTMLDIKFGDSLKNRPSAKRRKIEENSNSPPVPGAVPSHAAHIETDYPTEPQYHGADHDSSPVPEEVFDQDSAVPPRILEPDEVLGERKHWRESFPEKHGAGAKVRPGKTGFEQVRDEEILTGAEVLGPFVDEDEWELAKWLIKNVGHKQTESFLKLPIVSFHVQNSFLSKVAHRWNA